MGAFELRTVAAKALPLSATSESIWESIDYHLKTAFGDTGQYLTVPCAFF